MIPPCFCYDKNTNSCTNWNHSSLIVHHISICLNIKKKQLYPALFLPKRNPCISCRSHPLLSPHLHQRLWCGSACMNENHAVAFQVPEIQSAAEEKTETHHKKRTRSRRAYVSRCFKFWLYHITKNRFPSSLHAPLLG